MMGVEEVRSERMSREEDGQAKLELSESPGLVAGKQMPAASVVTRLILIMVWRKLIRNPNTYSSLIGLIWSLVSFRYNNVTTFLITLRHHHPFLCID